MLLLVPAYLDHITWSCTCIPIMHAIWLHYMFLLAFDNPEFSCPDPRVWTVALLYLIRVAQRERELAAVYLDPPSSSLPLIGSRDSYLATREYFSVFYIVHPAFMFPSDHVFLRYYIIPCDNCVLVLLLLDCILPLCFRTLISRLYWCLAYIR